MTKGGNRDINDLNAVARLAFRLTFSREISEISLAWRWNLIIKLLPEAEPSGWRQKVLRKVFAWRSFVVIQKIKIFLY
jgi:hypothetical protein